jgi:hypothetical protein
MVLAGISFRTQALYVTVFVARYLDLFTRYISLYNSLMKIFFIGSSVYILYLMQFKYRCVFYPACCLVIILIDVTVSPLCRHSQTHT